MSTKFGDRFFFTHEGGASGNIDDPQRPAVQLFAELNSAEAGLYEHPGDIDLFTGGVVEDPV